MNVISKTQTVSEADSLLEEGQAFKLTPVGERSYDVGKVALTWRWPRAKNDGHVTSVVSTTIVNARNLHKARVEEIDGQYFLISEPTKDYEHEIRLCIQDERVGSEILSALIGLLSSKTAENMEAEDKQAEALGIPSGLQRWNKIAEHLLPIATVTFLITMSIAALCFIF